jgi:mRNA interferase RelE/StbE
MSGSRKWSVEFLKAARASLADLPLQVRFQVSRKILFLEEDPLPASCKKLQGRTDLFRIRSGDYRVVYRIDRAAHRVTIVRIRPRKDVYRGL